MLKYPLNPAPSFPQSEGYYSNETGIKPTGDFSRVAVPSRSGPVMPSAKPSRIDAVLLDYHGVHDLYHLSRATLYRLTAKRVIQAKKVGRRTLWVHESIKQYLANAPAPELRAPAVPVNDNAATGDAD
jgi:predicted DNA-binding transcriptional regulator AlpA